MKIWYHTHTPTHTLYNTHGKGSKEKLQWKLSKWPSNSISENKTSESAKNIHNFHQHTQPAHTHTHRERKIWWQKSTKAKTLKFTRPGRVPGKWYYPVDEYVLVYEPRTIPRASSAEHKYKFQQNNIEKTERWKQKGSAYKNSISQSNKQKRQTKKKKTEARKIRRIKRLWQWACEMENTLQEPGNFREFLHLPA